jgi:hypothetical protein
MRPLKLQTVTCPKCSAEMAVNKEEALAKSTSKQIAKFRKASSQQKQMPQIGRARSLEELLADDAVIEKLNATREQPKWQSDLPPDLDNILIVGSFAFFLCLAASLDYAYDFDFSLIKGAIVLAGVFYIFISTKISNSLFKLWHKEISLIYSMRGKVWVCLACFYEWERERVIGRHRRNINHRIKIRGNYSITSLSVQTS